MKFRFHLGMMFFSLMGCCLQAQSGKGVAVVELFTSEGCSSCPPADAVLTNIHQAAAKSGAPVYTVAFHVDYWNRLGWTDRFSDPEYTRRQEAYAQHESHDQVYTPQMIVNGQTEFNGADSGAADEAVAAALRKPAIPLTVNSKLAGGQCAIDFSCPTAADTDVINVALVEDSMSSDVKAGENAGRHLNHSTVVRSFTRRHPTATRQDQLVIDLKGIDPKHSAVIVYVQDSDSFAVRGAAATQVSAAP